MNEYKELVFELFESKSGRTIANSSDAHAAILYSAMFKFADNMVCILCRNLKDSVFGNSDVLAQAQSFLQAGKKLHIALQDDPQPSQFLRMILNPAFDSQVKICRIGEVFLKDGSSFNFSTMDDRAYRLEPNREETKAIASAYDTDFTAKLNDIFQIITKMPGE